MGSLTVAWRRETIVVEQLAAIGDHLAHLMIAGTNADLLTLCRSGTDHHSIGAVLVAPVGVLWPRFTYPPAILAWRMRPSRCANCISSVRLEQLTNVVEAATHSVGGAATNPWTACGTH